MGLTFEQDHRGDWIATLDGYYHAAGWCKELAVRRLDLFLRKTYPSVWHHRKDVLADHFRAIPSNSHAED